MDVYGQQYNKSEHYAFDDQFHKFGRGALDCVYLSKVSDGSQTYIQ